MCVLLGIFREFPVDPYYEPLVWFMIRKVVLWFYIMVGVVLFCSTDVFSTGIWEELDEFTDPKLKQLAKAIPDAALGSRANSITTKYLGAFKRWKSWARDHKLPVFPVRAAYLVVYLQYVSEVTRSKAPLDDVFNVIAWATFCRRKQLRCYSQRKFMWLLH